MEKSLKRGFDFRLVYDCLANSDGLVSLELLLSHWPTDTSTPGACKSFWCRNASPEGFLDWQSFSGGLQAAFQRKDDSSIMSDQSRLAVVRHPVAQVTSGEIERFLSSCRSSGLVKALEKAGRDIHRWQVSIHRQDSHTEVVSKVGQPQRGISGNKQHSTGLSAAREREELLRGADVLQNTQRWFQSRLAVLSAEQKQRNIEKLGPEEVLAEMDAGEQDSHVLHHIKQINTHLSSLALTANALPPSTQPQKHTRPHHQSPSAVVEYPSSLGVQPQKTGITRAGRGKEAQYSLSLCAGKIHQPPARALHRSSSFTNKSTTGFGSQPMRQASSMTTLTQQLTAYPGHRGISSLQRPIRHSSSVQSLPSQPQHPLPFAHPPIRAHSTRSLPQEHQLVSEVL